MGIREGRRPSGRWYERRRHERRRHGEVRAVVFADAETFGAVTSALKILP